MKTIGVIPARFGSTRLAAKVLANIGGKPLVQHVWERAMQARQLDEVLIACDHEEILKTVKGFQGRAAMTDPACPSGSDRIAQAVHNMDVDIVVNIQGDEPFIDPASIDAVVALLKQDPGVLMGTAIKSITNEEEITNPNVVKCVIDTNGHALYFSRAPIPYNRDRLQQAGKYFKHFGLYAYRKDFLMEFKSWPKGSLETLESLEQLRVLEHGIKIKTTQIESDSMAVDTAQDLQKAQEWFDKLKLTTR